jgi:hypothetical protein
MVQIVTYASGKLQLLPDAELEAGDAAELGANTPMPALDVQEMGGARG